MSFLANFFQRKQNNNISSEQDKTFTIPPKLTATGISTVQLTVHSKKLWSVSCTLLSKPIGEWQVCLGLDSSYSMRDYYGKGLIGMPPADMLKEYQKFGELEQMDMDGDKFLKVASSAMVDLEKRGFSKRTENIVEPLTKKLINYFTDNVCQAVEATYYSCGEGNAFEKVGTFTKDSYEKITLDGPDQFTFGKRSKLEPVVKNFAKESIEKDTICIIITDGIIDDWTEISSYSKILTSEIVAQKRKKLKIVLLLVGGEVPDLLSSQLASLNADNDCGLWDFKVATELRSLEELFMQINSSSNIVADTVLINDENNNILREYKNVVPTKLEFNMSVESDSFSINMDDQVIQQKIPMMAYHLKD